jgi:prepilin-type N-terminal cleavage/methylation domain-containing protein
MRRSLFNNKRGFTLVEGLIAIFLVSVSMMALLSTLSPAWRLSSKSDYLGRAAGIMYRELDAWEMYIMNPCNVMTAQTNNWDSFKPGHGTASWTVNSSLLAAQTGDAAYTVTTVITDISPVIPGTVWQVRVTVTWPPLNSAGVTETVIVTQQEPFKFGCT